MNSILTEILEFIFETFFLRFLRRANGRKEHDLQRDTADMANLYILETVLSVIAVVVLFVLYLWLEWPFWLSFGLPAGAVGIYCACKYLKMVRNPD